MSPITSVATASVLYPAAPSVTPAQGLPGQSAPVMSQNILGTGGFLFAVVAIVSVAGYLYHGRGAANTARMNNTWASLASFLSSVRHRASTMTPTTGATDWPVDLEVGLEHVSMVYARFFHPMFWNLIECHPGTASTPAICVEEEAKEAPLADPKPFGMNSFLDMDDDNEYADKECTTGPPDKLDGGPRSRLELLPPYDTSSVTNVSFTSEIIGTTVRPGGFLSVPGELEDDLSQSDDSSQSSDSHSESDFYLLASDGTETTPPISSTRRHGMADMGYFAQSLRDAIVEEDQSLVPTVSFRAGLMNLSNFPETVPVLSCTPLIQLKHTDDEPTASDCDIDVHHSIDKVQVGSREDVTFGRPHECLDPLQNVFSKQPTEDVAIISNCDVGVRYSCDSLQAGSSDADIPGAPHDNSVASDYGSGFCDSTDGVQIGSSDADILDEPHDGPDLMRRLLAELRDPNLSCYPRALSEDSDSEAEGEAYIQRLRSPWGFHHYRQNSLESTSSDPGLDSDVIEDGSIYPLTPPLKSPTSPINAPDNRGGRMSPAITLEKNEEVRVTPAFSLHSPVMPSKAYIRIHGDSHSLMYGPGLLVTNLSLL